MRHINALLGVIFALSLGHANAFDSKESLLEQNTMKLKQKEEQIRVLARAKYFIFSGNLEKALIELSNEVLQTNNPSITTTRWRYLAIIKFLKGDYQDSLKILNQQTFLTQKHFPEICLQKTLLLMILDQRNELEKYWGRCQRYTSFPSQEFLWPQLMVEIYSQRNTHSVHKKLSEKKLSKLSSEEVKKVLKLSLFIQQEQTFLSQVESLTVEQLSDPEVRELLAMMYYRQDQFRKSSPLIDGLSSTNAENIRGNLALMQKKYELSYPQFKLVWANKFSTDSAALRALPLAWKINEWEDGLQIVQKIPFELATAQEISLFKAIFYTPLKKHREALMELDSIPYYSPMGNHFQVQQLKSYLFFQLSLPQGALFHTKRACQQQDIYSCWVSQQIFFWEDVFQTMQRNEPVTENPDTFLENILAEKDFPALQEEVLIDPRYIEELDRAALYIEY